MILAKTKRLYGENVDPKEWKYMCYIDVLKLKIKLASERLEELNLEVPKKRNVYNIEECLESVKKCRKLIQELEEC